MGREIRLVPPNWDHPKCMRPWGEVDYRPMSESSFEEVHAEWVDTMARLQREEFTEFEIEDYAQGDPDDLEGILLHAIAANPEPKSEDYVPWTREEATWVQFWETVSQGTPLSPPFATLEELAEYLGQNGDFWDQKRAREEGRNPGWFAEDSPWDKDAWVASARRMLEEGSTWWCPSGTHVVEAEAAPEP